MNRFLLLILFLSGLLFSQTETRIFSLEVSAVLNDRSKEITGTLRVDEHIIGTVSEKVSFLVPKNMNITSLRNGTNEKYDNDRSISSTDQFDQIMIDLSEADRQKDTLTLSIEYSTIYDSLSWHDMFVNQRELLLPYSNSRAWLPRFGSMTSESVSIEFTLPLQFTLIGEAPFDTSVADGMRSWSRRISQPVQLASSLTLCGIQNAVKLQEKSRDSLYSVTTYTSPLKFNPQYAAAFTRQLCDAIQFFTHVTGQQRQRTMTYAYVGASRSDRNIFTSKDLTIQRNSPAFGLFDTLSIASPKHALWLTDLARRYCPATTDSAALFVDGFASYLAARFLFTTFPATERQERFNAIADALTFFPSGTLSAGNTSAAHTNEIAANKGKFFFMMLEYLLGKDSFDKVIAALSERFSETPITIDEFRHLCENEYGSSLEKFFDEWLNGTEAPEFMIQWKSDKTPRGMTIVRLTVEQRGTLFSLPVPIVFSFGTRKVVKRIVVEQSKQEFVFTFPSVPTDVELDPDYSILRWSLEIRISTHARTSLQFLSINRDTVNAQREASYTIQLDPNNATGSAPLAYFVLGNAAAIAGNNDKAKEYFLKSASANGSEETEAYKLLSMVRFANVLEKEEKRDDAVTIYQRVIAEGSKNPLIFERALIESETFLREKIIPTNDVWYDIH